MLILFLLKQVRLHFGLLAADSIVELTKLIKTVGLNLAVQGDLLLNPVAVFFDSAFDIGMLLGPSF